VTDRRARARWYATKTHPSYQDMLIKLRRVLIAAQYRADPPREPTPQEMQAIRLAWPMLRHDRQTQGNAPTSQ
jgi:hypothetical protein